MSSQISVCML